MMVYWWSSWESWFTRFRQLQQNKTRRIWRMTCGTSTTVIFVLRHVLTCGTFHKHLSAVNVHIWQPLTQTLPYTLTIAWAWLSDVRTNSSADRSVYIRLFCFFFLDVNSDCCPGGSCDILAWPLTCVLICLWMHILCGSAPARVRTLVLTSVLLHILTLDLAYARTGMSMSSCTLSSVESPDT